ncbi:nickel pincer cofactor biosynthesis protein LarB [bacterium]|nr:nickel pincer cofactor biosynthesis protein LarB [bacterium]
MKDMDFAKLDIEREKRKGFAEAVFVQCKSEKELIEIFKTFQENNQNVIATKANQAQFEAIKKVFKNAVYWQKAKIITLIHTPKEKIGEIAICTAGTGDIPIAEEASVTAEFLGSNVKKYYDVGIAGIHRLLDKIDEIRKANVIVAIAGMEGALASVIAGLVDVPVIAVPTSVGYGSSFEGLSALLTMLNSCAEGITVVNIDNGFGAGYSANLINRRIEGK